MKTIYNIDGESMEPVPDGGWGCMNCAFDYRNPRCSCFCPLINNVSRFACIHHQLIENSDEETYLGDGYVMHYVENLQPDTRIIYLYK